MYVLLLASPKLEFRKHICVVNMDFVYDSQPTLECIATETEIQDLTLLDDSDHDWLDLLVEELVVRALKSTLVSGEDMAKYLTAKTKLGEDLQ